MNKYDILLSNGKSQAAKTVSAATINEAFEAAEAFRVELSGATGNAWEVLEVQKVVADLTPATDLVDGATVGETQPEPPKEKKCATADCSNMVPISEKFEANFCEVCTKVVVAAAPIIKGFVPQAVPGK